MNFDLHLSELKFDSNIKFNFLNSGLQQGESLEEDLMEEFRFIENNSFHGVKKNFQTKFLENIEILFVKLIIHSIDILE